MYRPGLGTYVLGGVTNHANGDVDMFNVAGGDVLITVIYGKVTTAVAVANTINIGNNPTLATATTVTWWTGVDCTGLAIGDIIGQRLVGGVATTTAVNFASVAPAMQYIALTGTIFIRATAIGSASQWTLYYLPLTPGATVTAI